MATFRYYSDIHNEFGAWIPPELPNESDTYLIIAGDLDNFGKKASPIRFFMNRVCPRFKAVYYVLGNHEYWGSNMGSVHRRCKELEEEFENLHILREAVHITEENIAIIGSTLWTDMDKGDPNLMYAASYVPNDSKDFMNDYKYIRTGTPSADPWNRDGEISYRRLTPHMTLTMHLDAKTEIFQLIKEQKAEGRKVVVISHHAPTWQSVDQQHIGDEFNGCYVSDLSNEILDTEPDIWVHGHVHASFDYQCGSTRVLCNPYGYQGHTLNKDFDIEASFELQ